MLNTWGKGKRRRFGWELCWFEDGNTDSERRTPHSHKKKDTFEPWLESASFDSFVPVAVKHLQCEHMANRPKMMGTRRWPVVALRLELHLLDVANRSQG